MFTTLRLSTDEGDLLPVQARRAGVLTSAPSYAQVVVDVNGRMAEMRTVAPDVFVQFKRWMADGAPDRDPLKRTRDRLQANVVDELLREGRLLARAPGSP